MEKKIREATVTAVKALFNQDIEESSISLNETRKEFEGDITVVVFPFTRFSKAGPEQTGEKIGAWLQENVKLVSAFNVVKGFLNLVIDESYWTEYLQEYPSDGGLNTIQPKGEKVVLEYCGPNTNKPLHLGHIRNMLIGYSLSEILIAAGYETHRVNIYNDRGIAICKSMIAWQKFGEGKTPEDAGKKGDHFVGEFYVKFDIEYRKQVEELVSEGMDKEEAQKKAPILLEAQEMLRQWEAGDKEVVQLWEMMNNWVYEGFDQTYRRIGIDFEKDYKESDYYLKGKDVVEEGLKEGLFFKKEDGSIWVDLSDEGLDEKLLIRSDGTSVYITQDLGVAEARFDDYGMDKMFYVVGDEQNYHFKVLKLILQKMNRPYADGITHVSYGMVDLPDGKMKSREGTTVDADDLMDQMFQTAEDHTSELGKTEGMDSEEARELFRKIGLGALKFFILRVNPKKRILFNPKESIDFQGFTGPFLQYTYARIQSVLRKAAEGDTPVYPDNYQMNEYERDIVLQLHKLPQVVEAAAANLDPSEVANYAFNLAKAYNKFYAECSILKAETPEALAFRLQVCHSVAIALRESTRLLGIEVPDRM
jgi:arginyl-tRNA synthetase